MRNAQTRLGLAISFLVLGSRAIGGTSAWQSPSIREVTDAFALAEAGRLTGDHAAARKTYADVIAKCTILLAGGGDTTSRPILLAAFAEADEQQRQLPAASGDARQQFSSQEALKLLASAKARADGLAGRGEMVRARLAYQGLLKAGEVLGQRFLTEENRKAVEWVSGRARRALASLPETAQAPAIAHEPIEQTIKDIVTGVRADIRPQPSGILKVEWGKFPIEPTDLAKLCPGAIRANAHPQPTDCALSWTLEERPGFPPPFGMSVATASIEGAGALLAAARKGLLPSADPASTFQLSAVQPVGVDATEAALAAFRKGLRPYSDAVLGIRVEGPDDLVMAAWRNGIKAVVADLARDDAGVSLESSKSLLEWLAAHGVGSEVVGELALAFSRKKVPASQGAITMGTAGPTADDLRLVALDACVTLLQTAPERDRDGSTAERAFRLAAELGRLAELEALLRERLESDKPGLLGPLLFKVLRGQRKEEEAEALMARMSERPERFLPASTATCDVLLQGFSSALSLRKLADAEARLTLLEAYRLTGEADRWLALARAHGSGTQETSQRIAERALAKSADKETRERAQSLLAGLSAGSGEEARRLKLKRDLANLAEEARINPRLYYQLAAAYRRAKMYPEARNAYDTAARRFDDPVARKALIETYFEEGKAEEGVAAATGFLADHPRRKEAQDLMQTAERLCFDRGEIETLASSWLQVIAGSRGAAGSPCIGKLAALLAKAHRNASDGRSPRLADIEEKARGLGVWPLLEAHVKAWEKALAQIVAPWAQAFDAVEIEAAPRCAGLVPIGPPQVSPVGIKRPSDLLRPDPLSLTASVETVALPPLVNAVSAAGSLRPWEVGAPVTFAFPSGIERPSTAPKR
ncbi:MAG TPA: hypothetical protein P5532_05270 [Planctomycetota bacterium]|nr:hypothetical protein [Planctomycetota bacterium]